MATTTETDPRYFTIGEVAERFRATEAAVRWWRYTGSLHGVRIGKRVLFSLDELAAFEADRRQAEQDRRG